MITVPDKGEFDALEARVKTLEAAVAVLQTPVPPPVVTPPPEPVPVPVPPAPSVGLYDDFAYNHNFTVGGKSPNGKWLCDFFGPNGFAKTDGNGLIISPAATIVDIRGGSAQVRSTQQWGNCAFHLDMTTEKQTAANAMQWMCSWLLFRHLDKWRHYYLYMGLDHMEFGKKDAPTNITDQAKIETYQKHLWTGGPPSPIGKKQHVGVEMIGDRFKIYVNGTLVMDKTDVSSFKTGSITPYSEGAQSRYQMLSVNPK